MTDIQDFIPVLVETADTIRARIEADVNAGLLPTDPSYLDTTPGGFWYDLSQAFVLEMERVYDVMGTDLPASMLAQYAWGTTLDEHGLVVGLERNDASFATGTVTFTGTVGTLIAAGVQVAVEQTDPDADPITFETTASGTIPGGGTLDLAIQATQAGASGNVAAGTVTVLLSSVAAPDGSAGIASLTNAAAITGGADIETDDKFRDRILIEWAGARGGGTVTDYEAAALAYPGVGFVTVVPVYQGGGTVAVIITDADNEPLSAAVVSGLQEELDPAYITTVLGGGGVTLPTGTITVSDTTGFDTSGRIRIGKSIVTYTGKTGTTFTGCTGGTGTYAAGVTVYGAGRGNGVAPIGAMVVVWSPTSSTITIVTAPVYETGYSSTGSGGTIAIGDEIKAALEAYVNGLGAGDDVVYLKAVAAVLSVPGVDDVTSLTLNGSATNVAVDNDHVAVTTSGSITVS